MYVQRMMSKEFAGHSNKFTLDKINLTIGQDSLFYCKTES